MASVTNSGTNTIIMRPGPGITIGTNLVGLDFTVGSINWVYDPRTGGITNSLGPVEVTNNLRILGGGITFTNGGLSGTNAWTFSQGLGNMSVGYNQLSMFYFANNGAFWASNFITPTNIAVDGYVPTATGTSGASAWKPGSTNYWFLDSRTGGISNSIGPVEITNNLHLLGGGLVFTNGGLSGTNDWTFSQSLGAMQLSYDQLGMFYFANNGAAWASNWITPTNTAIVGYIPTATSTRGDSQWSLAAPFVAAGTNVSFVTNGNVVTISATATNGGGTGQFVQAGTNITAVTNGSVVTLSVSTNPVVIAGTNVTVQTNGLAYTVNATSSGGGGGGVGPGTLNYISKFNSTTTNVIDSIMVNTATNQVEWRSRPSGTTWTNAITNRIYAEYTSEANSLWWDFISAPSQNGYFEIVGNQGASRTTIGINPIKIGSLIIEPTANPISGHTAYNAYPFVNDNGSFGITSDHYHVFNSGSGGYLMQGQAASTSTLNFGHVAGYGFALSQADMGLIDNGGNIFARFYNTGAGQQGLDIGVRQLMGGDTDSAYKSRTSFLMFHDNNVVQIGTNNVNGSTAGTARIQGMQASGTDKPGGDFVVSSGIQTGNGNPPNLYLATSGTNGTTGVSTLGTLTNRVKISGQSGDLTLLTGQFIGNGGGLTNIASGSATNAIANTNGSWVGTVTGDQVNATNYLGGTATLSTLTTTNTTGSNYFAAKVNVSGAVNATGYTNSGLTASRLILTDANKAQTSAATSGAVPVDADGSATTSAQVNTLFPSAVLTNNHANAITISNTVTIDAAHALTTTTPTIYGYLDAQTNSFTTNSAFPLGFTNLILVTGANTGAGITGVANAGTSTERWGQLTIVTSGTFVWTNPASIHASDFVTTRTITNGNTAVISVDVFPGQCTNMAIVQFK
jgi:hypothetical protein